eukprot:6200076-Pleurochrysis_carterae.AAC.8
MGAKTAACTMCTRCKDLGGVGEIGRWLSRWSFVSTLRARAPLNPFEPELSRTGFSPGRGETNHTRRRRASAAGYAASTQMAVRRQASAWKPSAAKGNEIIST